MLLYYKNKAGNEAGPVSTDELLKLEAQGLISNETEVRPHSGAEWQTWGEFRLQNKDVNKANAFGFLMGIWTIVLKFFLLPFELVINAYKQVLSWGISGSLPTAESDVPVLTFITIVFRPVVHLLSVLCGILWAVWALVHGQIPVMIIALIQTYFAQIAIAIVFEIYSLLISIANNIKKMADK